MQSAQLSNVNGRLAKGEGWIGYRGSGTKFLYFAFYRNGKQVFVNTKSNDPEEAYRQLLEARGATERGISVLPTEAARLTYEHLRDKYIEATGSKRRYELNHLDSFFHGRKALAITHDTVDKYITHRRNTKYHGRNIEDPTIKRELTVLRAIFNEAKNRKMISADQVPYFNMPKDSKGVAQYIDPSTFLAIRDRLPNGKNRGSVKGGPTSETNLQPFFMFLYATACRLGVAQTIPWAWVNKDFTAITIPPGVTKNDEALTLSLKGAFLAPVRTWMATQFRNDKSPVFDSTNFRPEWAKACAAAGFGTFDKVTKRRTGFRIHDCRASAAINLLDAGAPENIVLRIGGWKTRAMLDRYAKLTAGRAHAAMEASGDYIQKLAEAGK